ncbi:hypothetical protein PF010_g12181 [Phytophthora fragariae]|uniref:Uncharacterized protein n=1 Tax=Phytophthora fragariae TaxID=53985 RepID=A0A6A3WQ45_9STRA|nr:hypothetical protein PF003_g19094 [Phytophthora fragariae]KAE9001773.1 hypothetical protein PF011_g13602 [Phytophthora fragariae]KAE9073860.1 hypothetical protein PF007_g25643 [Phytophthora fragariae]KAE9092681.1 hypothetical protein PF006_g24634 [Phytophthora fragariae]KAE9107689.1 hypothetical protein PF010_g12181 [Phytophthora fragariae]
MREEELQAQGPRVQEGVASGESVLTEVFQGDDSIVTKTVKTTSRTSGKLVRTVEVETTTETETTSGKKCTTVKTEMHEEIETEESSLTVTSGSTTSVSGACAIGSTVEVRTEAPGATAKPQRWQQDEAYEEAEARKSWFL